MNEIREETVEQAVEEGAESGHPVRTPLHEFEDQIIIQVNAFSNRAHLLDLRGVLLKLADNCFFAWHEAMVGQAVAAETERQKTADGIAKLIAKEKADADLPN